MIFYKNISIMIFYKNIPSFFKYCLPWHLHASPCTCGEQCMVTSLPFTFCLLQWCLLVSCGRPCVCGGAAWCATSRQPHNSPTMMLGQALHSILGPGEQLGWFRVTSRGGLCYAVLRRKIHALHMLLWVVCTA
jgi:hypothetical protein